jgi:GlpG protein
MHSYSALVTIEQHNIALLFCNYLQSQTIEAHVIETDQGYVIACQNDNIEQAKQLFERFIIEPHHPRYQQAAWHHAQTTSVFNNQPSLLNDFKNQFLVHAGLFTLNIFIGCWLIFIGCLLGWQRELFYSLQFFPQLNSSAFFTEPYRLLTPAFLHFSWLHIVFNTMWWWQLGGSIEQKLGKEKLFYLFIISAAISNFAQYIVSGANFGGLSGVVYGVMGYVWWLGWLAPEKGLTLSNPVISVMIGWMILGFINILPIEMANTAHLLGLISGCLLAWFEAKKKTVK